MERTDPHRPHPAHPLSLAQAAAVDRERRRGEAVGAGCGAAGARGHVRRTGARRRGAAWRRAGTLPRPPPHPRRAARVDRDSDAPASCATCAASRATCSRRRSAASSSGPTRPNGSSIVVADAAGVPPARSSARSRHAAPRARAPSGRGRSTSRAKINAGVAASAGAHVVLFNDDLEVDRRRLADGDARVLTGAGDRRGRRASCSTRTAACSTSAC